jgi:hypothetical protein
MSKETRELEYPAAYVVFWPGQEVYACDKHREDLYGLNLLMGGPSLSCRDLLPEDPHECSNCINEGARG